MAKHVNFKESNALLRADPGEGDEVDAATNEVVRDGVRIGDLDVYKDDKQIASCWQLSAEELMEVMRTGRVYVFVLGNRHPPIYVGTTLFAQEEEPEGPEKGPDAEEAPEPIEG